MDCHLPNFLAKYRGESKAKIIAYFGGMLSRYYALNPGIPLNSLTYGRVYCRWGGQELVP